MDTIETLRFGKPSVHLQARPGASTNHTRLRLDRTRTRTKSAAAPLPHLRPATKTLDSDINTPGGREEKSIGRKQWGRRHGGVSAFARAAKRISENHEIEDFATEDFDTEAFELETLDFDFTHDRFCGNTSISVSNLGILGRSALTELGYSRSEEEIARFAIFARLWTEQVGIEWKSINDRATQKKLKKWLSIGLVEGLTAPSLKHLQVWPIPNPAGSKEKFDGLLVPTMAPQIAMTPQLGQFLVQINGFLQHENGDKLAEWLRLEPFSDGYPSLAAELRQAYPMGTQDQLREKCTQALPVARDGLEGSPSWTQFILFMVQYLSYLRDVTNDQSKYLETYELLYELQQKANSALTHPSLGHIMLPTVVSCAKMICHLGIGLEKRPELMAQLRQLSNVGQDGEDGPRKTLPERAAELIRHALVTCLNDRNAGLDSNGCPEGKKRGIYTIANVCLKILWQCRKTRNASQIFTNIGNLSPPLAAYPKHERITYLYYLGRFWFQNNHFYRSLLALQHAYDECSARPEFAKQRRLILIYLITSNIIMGRLPSEALFQRPEARGLYERFEPINRAIKTGNLILFRDHLNFDGPLANWFLHFHILLQLQNRCEVLVWRSLIRKVFTMYGTFPPRDSRTGAWIDMNDFVTAFGYAHRRSKIPQELSYTNPDFEGADYDEREDNELPPSIASIESILMSLVEQGLVRGFIVHARQRLYLHGVKLPRHEALAHGFPEPWSVIQQRAEKEKNPDNDARFDDVPGWRKAGVGPMSTGGLGGGGTIINLSGARPIGVS